MITLYIKVHNITGMKYFGKTVKDPYKYKGSGKYWKRHLAVHGDNVTTIIFGVYELDSQELVKHATIFSKEYDIVKSIEWANLINENGHDGNCIGSKHTAKSKALIGAKSIGRKSPRKGKTYEEYYGTDSVAIIAKMKSSDYHKANSYEERFGKDAGKIRAAVSKRVTGANNPNASKWKLINPAGQISIIIDLKSELLKLALPYGTLKDSVFYNRPVLRGKAKGWQLLKISGRQVPVNRPDGKLDDLVYQEVRDLPDIWPMIVTAFSNLPINHSPPVDLPGL